MLWKKHMHVLKKQTTQQSNTECCKTHHKERIPFCILCLVMITSPPGYLIWISPMCVCNLDICSCLGKLVRGTRVLSTNYPSIYSYNIIYKLISLCLEIIEFSCCCHYSLWKPFSWICCKDTFVVDLSFNLMLISPHLALSNNFNHFNRYSN